MKISKIASFFVLLGASASALATPCGLTGFPPCPVPEPGMLGLVGVAVAALAYVYGRRK